MKLSPKAKRNVVRIIPFGFIWLIFGLSYLLLEIGLLGDLSIYPNTGNPRNFGISNLVVLAFVTCTGLAVGSIEIFYLNNLFIKRSFGSKILVKSLIYVLIIIAFLSISTLISNSIELETGVFDQLVLINLWNFVTTFSFWALVFYISLPVGVSLFFSEVSENLGLRVLHNFFIGKYHTPVEEERIFMFLDMKSSTTIAEELGHVRYFEMLKEYYSDFTDPIIRYSGEIYQYVGDEIVISWRLEEGLLDNNFLECFFAMKGSIQERSSWYQAKFGVVPDFKAGLHAGKVTTGEIGVLKKDIIFTGDVLNATARIQSLCNTHHTDILLSDYLKRLTQTDKYRFISLGEMELRGRKEQVELFTIQPKDFPHST